ncbi:MAG: hypothetical protein K2O62_05855, partial [Clostridia bacterium]|nr:hypothetical protein [Clostridia bacterium]
MGFGKDFWVQYWERIKHMAESFSYSYILEFIIFALAFYLAFRILKGNKGGKLIALFCGTVIVFGIAFSLSTSIDSQVLVLVVFLLVTVVVMMFDTEIKRSLLGTGPKKHHAKGDSLTVRDIEFIIDEITHAVQHMS